MSEKIKRKPDKIYLAIFVVVALVVGGILVWWSRKQVQEINKEAEINTEIKIEKSIKETKDIDTSKWKTYVNEEYGYSVKVPEEWDMKEVKRDGDITPSVTYIDSKPISSIPVNTEFDTLMNIYVSTLDFQKETEDIRYSLGLANTEKEITVDNIECTEITGIDEMYGEDLINIVCLSQGKNYVVAYIPKEEYKKKINLVLSTFRFK